MRLIFSAEEDAQSMKAKEYYEKHRFALLNPERGITPYQSFLFQTEFDLRKNYRDQQQWLDVYAVFKEFLKEVQDLRRSRRALSKSSMDSILSELNQKWNVLCDLFQKNDTQNPLQRDYFIEEYRQLEKKVYERMKEVARDVQDNW